MLFQIQILTYSPPLIYWKIKVYPKTFTKLEHLWRDEKIMPAEIGKYWC